MEGTVNDRALSTALSFSQAVSEGCGRSGRHRQKPRAAWVCSGRLRESPPAAAATRRPGRVALVSFDGPSGALSRSSERRFNCGQPSMHFFGCRRTRRLRLAVPAAAASLFGGDGVRWRWRACAGLDSRPRAAPHGRGLSLAAARPPRAATVRLVARLLPVVREGIRRFAVAVCRLGYAPAAAESAAWRTVPCPVHLPGRRGILAAWHVGRGNPRPGPGFPDRRRIAPGASGFPDCRVSPAHGRSATVNAELLRRAQDALDFRVPPATPHKGGNKAGRILPASSAGHQLNFPARARHHGGRASFSAPSLPLFRHARRVRQGGEMPCDDGGAAVTGR